MLNFNCTKAAADFFTSTKKGKKISPIVPAPHKTIDDSIAESQPESTDPLQWHWLLHAIKVKGKHVLLAMDYQSRFSITLSALKKGDDESFLNNFEHHLMTHVYELMATINADIQAIDTSLERYRHQHNHCAFYLRGDRSVQAHINDVVWHFRSWADETGEVPVGVDLISFDAFANQLLRRRKNGKDYFFPQREFLHAWLRHYGEYNTAQADACIEVLRVKERAEFVARHPELSHPKLSHSESGQPSEATDISLSSDDHSHKSPGNNVVALDDYRKK